MTRRARVRGSPCIVTIVKRPWGSQRDTTVLEEIGEKPHFEATRVGWKRPGSITAIRPVNITVPSSIAVHQILMKTGRLRLVESHKDVWICPDISSEERATSNKEASGH